MNFDFVLLWWHLVPQAGGDTSYPGLVVEEKKRKNHQLSYEFKLLHLCLEILRNALLYSSQFCTVHGFSGIPCPRSEFYKIIVMTLQNQKKVCSVRFKNMNKPWLLFFPPYFNA